MGVSVIGITVKVAAAESSPLGVSTTVYGPGGGDCRDPPTVIEAESTLPTAMLHEAAEISTVLRANEPELQ